jgi:tRNA threonylcarbamoyladenosine biosynthesis protein TsaB
MKILAIDTATEQCSVALMLGDRVIERVTQTARGHADLVLPMVESILQESGLRFEQLDGIAYGRGPGAFTGVRIAVSVAQGLAFGANLPTVGISDLAAVAQQVAVSGDRILVCMDARMGEVYWGRFHRTGDATVIAASDERVSAPEAVVAEDSRVLAGTGFRAHPQLATLRADAVVHDSVLPRAGDIARLAEIEFRAGRGKPAAAAEPVYLRDRVVAVKSP